MGMTSYQMLLQTVNSTLDNGDWESVFNMLKDKAEAGDASAMTILGQFYEKGVGIFEDIETAIEYYESGLDSGCKEAAGFLADLYSTGEKVQRDEQRAFDALLRGAELGDTVCAGRVAECYLHGQGVEKDANAALAWGLRAAKAGDVYSMGTVGDIYLNMFKNPREAYEWYTRTLENGMDEIYLVKMQVVCLADPFSEFNITPDSSSYQKAAELCSQNLHRDDDGALHLMLGRLYLEGLGVPQDGNYSHELVAKAASMGNAVAREILPHFRRNIFGGYTFQ